MRTIIAKSVWALVLFVLLAAYGCGPGRVARSRQDGCVHTDSTSYLFSNSHADFRA